MAPAKRRTRQRAAAGRIVCRERKELADDDSRHMAKAVVYVRRRLAQGGPAEHKEHSRWRYPLMN